MRLLRLAAAVALTAPLVSGCGSGGDAGTTIAASFYPLQFVAERVAGDRFGVTNLTSPGQEPHDTELSIKQTAALSGTKVVFYEKGMSGAVDEAVHTAQPPHVVDATSFAQLEGDDPHFWLDPTRLSAVAAGFEKSLAAADPSHASEYAANLGDLQSDLGSLDRDLKAGLAHCKVNTIVVSHDAFEYFGRRYGLHVVPIAGLSPDAEPAPAYIAQLHDLIKSDHVTTVFNEELASPAMAKALARDLGITTAVLDPIEGLADATRNDDYLSLMRKNLAALQKANDCT